MKKPQAHEKPHWRSSQGFEDSLCGRVVDVNCLQLGLAASAIRKYLVRRRYQEILLNPIDSAETRFPGVVISRDIGTLRFNTEPEIWAQWNTEKRFYSITPLFRSERHTNPFRRNAFHIVDFYQPGSPRSVLSTFFQLCTYLGKAGILPRLAQLGRVDTHFDPVVDGPNVACNAPTWIVASGYDAASSFYEIDSSGRSTRQEIFLGLPGGHLEIAALGIVGLNCNPRYRVRTGKSLAPPPGMSGLGLGLERLLLAEQLLSTL